jgi:hypothetical protein
MRYFFYIVLVLLVVSCNATKKVPSGSYLLNKVKINTDTRSVSESDLKPYLRQRPNSSMLFFDKVKLHAYNIPNNDSTWLNRQFLKFGELPVLYSDRLTGLSIEQIRLQLNNKGYLNAEVDTIVGKKNKKANVTYKVTGNNPYLVRTFKDSIFSVDSTIYKILDEKKRLNVVKEGDIFDKEVLEEGWIRITNELRNNGYYNFTKDNLYFLADTTLGTHQVDLTLGLNNPTDSTLHSRYRFGEVIVNNGVSSTILQDSSKHYLLDTIQYRDIKVVQERDKFLRRQVIFYNTFIRPGRIYSDRLVERTYSSLNRLGSVSQTAINLTPVVENDSNFINANISIFPGNMHYLQFGVDGTHAAGDLGIATDATYEHKNALKGGETFRVKLNVAYEFIPASDSINLIDKSYYEYGAEAFLSIPQLLLPWVMKQLKDQPSASTEFSIGTNFQNRSEYLRQFFNLSSRFQWLNRNWQVTNVVEPIAITYVRMPRMSDRFREAYMNDSINPILKASYEEQLIVRSAYNISYSNVLSNELPPRIPFRIRAGIEVAGYLPRLATMMGVTHKNASGREVLFGIPYSEYVKTDFDFAPAYRFDDKHTLAGHIAIGFAYPCGNSIVLPFEKRYYGGGANSIRGWSTRSLGPGTYNNDSLGYDFANKTGDIKLDMSVEFRRKLTSLFELAAFIDAGNVWTIKNYKSQPGGYFTWNSFYKELAAAYGLGVRLDLNFLLLRVDLGMKAHNPALSQGKRWTIFKPEFRRDFAFHFAIGYPF